MKVGISVVSYFKIILVTCVKFPSALSLPLVKIRFLSGRRFKFSRREKLWSHPRNN